MLGLRQKIWVGFGGLLLIIGLIGLTAIIEVSNLGGAIDAILRENYRSVLACQEMKQALDHMDRDALAAALSAKPAGVNAADSRAFERALTTELNTITLPGEYQQAHLLAALYGEYRQNLLQLAAAPDKRELYLNRIEPLSREIKATADGILKMNQQNMFEESQRAKSRAAKARSEMFSLLALAVALAVIYMLLIGKWILQPIRQLTQSVDEIRQGNLDLVVASSSRDEIGHLSEAFNEMTASLRGFRRDGEAKLSRVQQSAQQTFNSLPNAVAVVDLAGRVEMSTETARQAFGLRPGVTLGELKHAWLKEIFEQAAASPMPGQRAQASVIQHFVNAQEHYFKPEATAILNARRQPTGVLLMLNDVSEQLFQDELKRGFIATVSHQLKTPLTSVRMALHILLEQKIGELSPKQADLLVAAREDSDRLYEIIENLLSLSRIEAGKAALDFVAADPAELIGEAIEAFHSAAVDQGVELKSGLSEGLPAVRADRAQVGHVFANLISNALRYTPAGGRIAVTARLEGQAVRFSVSDSGQGIPPRFLPLVFEQFFRVPGQSSSSGTGLGLAIAREIVEAHGGGINVESSEGQGSTFSFSLPLA